MHDFIYFKCILTNNLSVRFVNVIKYIYKALLINIIKEAMFS